MTPEQLEVSLNQLDAVLARAKSDDGAKRLSSERRAPSGTASVEAKKQSGHGPKPQPNLPVETVTHPLDEADQMCPSCGGQLKLWPGQADETEEVHVVERRFVLLKHVRPKYRCSCGGCVEQAPAEPRVVPGGRYSNDFAVEVAINKYLDYLPLERQVRIMRREGLDVDSQTLWDYLNAMACLLAPALIRVREAALAGKVLGFDETRWPVLQKGATKDWTMWQLSTPELVYFSIAPSRDTAEGERFLDGFGGIAIGDAASVHRCIAKARGFTLAFCWAHARRHFRECSPCPS
jgi:transposase